VQGCSRAIVSTSAASRRLSCEYVTLRTAPCLEFCVMLPGAVFACLLESPALHEADTSGVFSPTWDAVDGPIAPPGGDGILCGKPRSLDGRLPRVRNQEWTHAAAESRARPKAAQQGLSHAPGAKPAQMHVTPRYSSVRTRLHGEMRTSCRPRFAHPRAAGAVRTPNCYDGPDPLFLVRYAADLRMARVWQPPSSGTHQAERVTLPHGFSVGEFDGPE
jgi:hypothetical protein